MASEEEDVTLDQLPYLCLISICEFLTAEDTGRFSVVCKAFNETARAERLWRRHSMRRWAFCDIRQVKGEDSRWLRYYMSRRKVENRMDQGRPTKDYRVRSLRGHKTDIVTAVCMSGVKGINWEQLAPPILVSLSSDSVVHAWNVIEGKPVWSIEDQPVTCLTGNDQLNMVATGDRLGQVTLYNAPHWSLAGNTHCDGPVVAVAITQIQEEIILLASIDGDIGTIIAWNIAQLESPPLFVLSSLSVCAVLSVNNGQWLAGSNDSTDATITVWDLRVICASPSNQSCDPHVTIHRQTVGPSLWLSPGVLVTGVAQFYGLIPVPGPQVRRRIVPFAGSVTEELEVWNVAKHCKESKVASSNVYRVSHMYDASRSLRLVGGACNVLKVANGVLLTGDSRGVLSLVDSTSGQIIQSFSDHKGPITDIHADNYRVLTCSEDFSIRVYRWKQCEGVPLQLESLYQLLGGSVAHKTHDGFIQVLCSAGSCVGVAGNIVKLYNFTEPVLS